MDDMAALTMDDAAEATGGDEAEEKRRAYQTSSNFASF